MQKPIHQIYSFDEFTLDLTRGCLLRQTEEIKLRPKSFEVLKYLAENGGRLVSKDELINLARSKDGKTIALARGQRQHDAVLLTNFE